MSREDALERIERLATPDPDWPVSAESLLAKVGQIARAARAEPEEDAHTVPCERCRGTGARHVAGEPTQEPCGECSGEGVVCKPKHSVEAGMFSQTPPAEEAPESVRVDRPNQLNGFIQFGVVQDGTGVGQEMLCRLRPATGPHKEGIPMWTCECGASGTAATPEAAVRDVRRHFWHNHADRRVRV